MKVILKKGKEKPILQGHPWIFSGAIDKSPSQMQGEILPVYSQDNLMLGSAYFNTNSSLTGRMISLGDQDPFVALKNNILNALAKRKSWFGPETTGYRLINGEGDFIPGLIVDCYDDLAVIQSGTLGIDKLLSFICEILDFKNIYLKSDLPSRKEEGLPPCEGWIRGGGESKTFFENGLKFNLSVKGQKTGFFLDQREMRDLVRKISKGKKVLNTFSYTGGFTVAALAGGALEAVSVDISKDAIEKTAENIALNGFPSQKCIAGDVFEFLREDPINFNVVILDPPAFAKKQKDVVQACRGYKDINRVAMSKMPPNSYLLTSSCSHFVDDTLFQQVVFQASREANRSVQILQKHSHAWDHPINLAHKEGGYLKSLVLYIT